MSNGSDILKSLEPMFEKAEKEGLWFYCSYQDLWFKPQELKEKQSNGRFIWGSDNWELRHPFEKIIEINKLIKNLEKSKQRFL